MLSRSLTMRPLAPLLLVLLLAAGCQKQPPAAPPPAPPEVGIITLQPERVVLTSELPGRVTPHLIAEVRPQVGGIIQKRLFTEGNEVKAGQVLYQIDPAAYQAELARAQAALARAEANLTPARLKAERYRELIDSRAVSHQEFDDAEATLQQTAAEVASARAAVESARINLDYTTVKAPIAGRIGRSAVTTGALVKASQDESLATIQQLDPVYVDITQTAADLLSLKQRLASGQLKGSGAAQASVRLVLEDGSTYESPGTLRFAEVTVDQGTGSVTLRTLFPNPDQLLLPGMFVRAIVEEGVSEGALLVPQRGVSRNPAGQPLVMVVGAEEKVEARPIKALRTLGDRWLVSEGLQPGERVILEGFQRARPGTVVKAVPFAAPAAAAPQPAAPAK